MPTAIVTQSNGRVTQVQLVPAEGTEDTVVEAEVLATTGAASGETTAEVKTPPNPIAATPNELAWTAGSFFVLLIVMRYFLFPKLKKATDARYEAIRADIEGADEVKSSARTAVAEYEAARAAIQSEAAARIDAARQTLDNERTAQLAQVNERVASARAASEAATAQAKAAAQGQIASAVATVVTSAAELATGQKPDASTVETTVKAVMDSAVTR
jgi:F-type H+-transporting ATPase subunit b